MSGKNEYWHEFFTKSVFRLWKQNHRFSIPKVDKGVVIEELLVVVDEVLLYPVVLVGHCSAESEYIISKYLCKKAQGYW